MAKYILAGVGIGMGIDSTGALIVSGDTYTESSISVEVSSEDIRGKFLYTPPILCEQCRSTVLNALNP